jgi:hypothetical protein
MMAVFVYASQSYPAASENGPIIYFDETDHVFPTVFEGGKLTHTFVVSNQGTATLNIVKLTHS